MKIVSAKKRIPVMRTAWLTMALCLLLFISANQAQAQSETCAEQVLFDPINGENTEACGIEDSPCQSLEVATVSALSCSADLGTNIEIVKILADGPLIVGVANNGGIEVEESSEGDEPSWYASRSGALIFIFALLTGIILGVIVGARIDTQAQDAATATAIPLFIIGALFLTSVPVRSQESCPGHSAFYSPRQGVESDMCGSEELPCKDIEILLGRVAACTEDVTLFRDGIPIVDIQPEDSPREEKIVPASIAESVASGERSEIELGQEQIIWWFSILIVGFVLGYASQQLKPARL